MDAVEKFSAKDIDMCYWEWGLPAASSGVFDYLEWDLYAGSGETKDVGGNRHTQVKLCFGILGENNACFYVRRWERRGKKCYSAASKNGIRNGICTHVQTDTQFTMLTAFSFPNKVVPRLHLVFRLIFVL